MSIDAKLEPTSGITGGLVNAKIPVTLFVGFDQLEALMPSDEGEDECLLELKPVDSGPDIFDSCFRYSEEEYIQGVDIFFEWSKLMYVVHQAEEDLKADESNVQSRKVIDEFNAYKQVLAKTKRFEPEALPQLLKEMTKTDFKAAKDDFVEVMPNPKFEARKLIDRYLVLSLHLSEKSSVLWGLEADASKGVALRFDGSEFDTPPLFMNYTDDPKEYLFPYREFIKLYCAQLVVNADEEGFYEERFKLLFPIMLKKNQCWSYQKEARFVFGKFAHAALLIKKKDESGYERTYMRAKPPKMVFFGPNVSISNLEKWIPRFKSLGIEIGRTHFSEQGYSHVWVLDKK